MRILDRAVNTSSRCGYALVLVLATLAIASASLVALANRSLRENAGALEQMDALQAKWGQITCGQALLPLAPAIFDSMEVAHRESHAPIATQIRDRIILGNQVFELVLADEDAKVNLNSSLLLAGPDAVRSLVRDLVDPRFQACVRPAPQLSARQPALTSWGQLFDFAGLRKIEGDDRAIAELTSQITLWGPGRLNIHRASDEAIRALCTTVLPIGSSNRILATLRESEIKTEVTGLLERTVQSREDRERLRQLLGAGSTTYSLWIETGTTATGSRLQQFFVQSTDETGLIRTTQFVLD